MRVLTATSAAALTLACAAALAGCGEESSPSGTAGTPSDSASSSPSAGSSSSAEPTASSTLRLPQSDDPVTPDPSALTPDIDHRYWPMKPRTRWTYREVDEEGVEMQVVVTVTSETKKLANGAVARVIRDTVSEDGEVVEDTFDWYAQDEGGTIWYLGEDTAEFEDGELASQEGSFEAGVDGALAGVILPGEPQVGQAYRQEFYEGEAEDNGEVLSLSEKASVPAGSYRDVLQTADTNALEPDVLEHKYYAPGVGPVLTVDVKGGGREELLEMATVSRADAARAGTTPLGEAY